jgi:hypothetical protein
MPPWSLQRPPRPLPGAWQGFSSRTREGATGLPGAVSLAALFRDQEAERAGREHRSCAGLRPENLDSVRHEFLVNAFGFLLGHDRKFRRFIRRTRLLRLLWQGGWESSHPESGPMRPIGRMCILPRGRGTSRQSRPVWAHACDPIARIALRRRLSAAATSTKRRSRLGTHQSD